jgi:hypothetical protein
MSRSQSRGREGLISSGRGGAGNIRPASRDPVARVKGPDDLSPTRGRELPVIGNAVCTTHSSSIDTIADLAFLVHSFRYRRSRKRTRSFS